jgi:hypothetical protein
MRRLEGKRRLAWRPAVLIAPAKRMAKPELDPRPAPRREWHHWGEICKTGVDTTCEERTHIARRRSRPGESRIDAGGIE